MFFRKITQTRILEYQDDTFEVQTLVSCNMGLPNYYQKTGERFKTLEEAKKFARQFEVRNIYSLSDVKKEQGL